MTAGQTGRRLTRRRSSGKSILPLLSYYLTFIHYFGFSINPNDDSSQRYLPIQVKRVPQATRIGAANTADQWLASYRMRAKSSYTSLLMSSLRTGIKFTAISFTTFLALNHCIVLVDYIYRGTMEFEELMFDVRLVITKFSALIFVLSWHWKQSQVRQLIKLVKSTSIYILGTGLTATTSGALPVKGVAQAPCGSPGDRSAPQTCPSRHWTELANVAQSFLPPDHNHPIIGLERLAANKQTTMMEGNKSSSSNKPPPMTANGHQRHQSGEQIGDCNNLIHESITQRIDRRILKWWLMCVSVTVLHFSLSEAELTKSHHLWQWLDDYSLHQLNNETTSKSTLLLLASFDNYIYTVHVYGTRLIGASIICIVCSFQCENIASLRWHTLQLIRSLAQHSAVVASAGQPHPAASSASRWWLQSHDCTANSVDDDTRERADYWRADRSWHWQHLFASSALLKDVARKAAAKRDPQSRASCGMPAAVAQEQVADRDLFFVLAESDWIQVRENVARLSPCGYLSSSMWSAERSLLGVLSQLPSLIWAVCCLRPVRAIISKFASQWAGSARADRHARGDNTHQTLAKHWRLPHDSASFSSLFPLRVEALNEGSRASDPHNWATPIATGSTSKPAVVLAGAQFEPTPKQPQTLGYAFRAAGCRATHYHSDYHYQQSCIGPNVAASDAIEWQLERLASKYELVRTVNGRIDSCFGPMLLIQFSFLFLMSCIDVVYFSICFNPNTKTKYIIISGMILLWWPYLLLYKFASDIGTSSKELLISVRRLARLSLILSHSGHSDQQPAPAGGQPRPALSSMSHLAPRRPTDKPSGLFEQQPKRLTMFGSRSHLVTTAGRTRARIINKLDHVFKPTTLSILDILTVDKFFLLNFAKIVITASVMIIQFISK